MSDGEHDGGGIRVGDVGGADDEDGVDVELVIVLVLNYPADG